MRDELRDVIVPINKKYPLEELLEACRAYPGVSNARRITFEYVMLKGVNDTVADARELVRPLRGIPAKINLIPFNPWPGAPYECSDWEQIEKFAEIVNRAGYASPVRTPRGRDIMAACGQLKSESVKQRASERMAEMRSQELARDAGIRMRDQYAGDISDYIKFAFLRCLLLPKQMLGIGWYYLGEHDGRRDGRHREYLSDSKWSLSIPNCMKF